MKSIYIAPEGVIDIQDRRFTGSFGEMVIPNDVWARGARLHRKGFVEHRYAYMAAWCDYQLEKAWKAGRAHA